MIKKNVAVFGSAFPVEDDDQYKSAYKLGSLLAENNFNVLTGGYLGIMEAVSKGVYEKGGEAVGVTLSYINSPGNKYLSRKIICNSLFERIQTLIDNADGFVILQGGTGTLLELAAVWEFINKKLILPKPAACFSSLWKEVGNLINSQLALEKRDTKIISFFEDEESIVKFLKDNIRR